MLAYINVPRGQEGSCSWLATRRIHRPLSIRSKPAWPTTNPKNFSTAPQNSIYSKSKRKEYGFGSHSLNAKWTNSYKESLG
jgi:hypothetical protein